jgi:transposase InsO family protein
VPVRDLTAETAAEALLTAIVCRYGVPQTIMSDKGSAFTGHVFEALYERLGIKSAYTSGYHPNANGLAEAFNKTLCTLLNTYINDRDLHKGRWDEYLPYVMFSYRCHYHSNSKASPFYLLFGRAPDTPTRVLFGQYARVYADTDEYSSEVLRVLPSIWQFAQDRLKAIAAEYYNDALQQLIKGRLNIYDVGDKVMRVIPPSKPDRKVAKLKPKFNGPYTVLRVITPVTYQIQNDETHDILVDWSGHLKPYLAHPDDEERKYPEFDVNQYDIDPLQDF